MKNKSNALAMDRGALEAKVKSLGNLTKDRRAARKVSRNKDTIHTLKTALDNSPKFAKMVEYSVTCIKNLAVDVTSAIELIDEGVIESLVNVMNLNPYNERIMELINQAVSALCLNEELSHLVHEKFGTKGIIRSLNKHKTTDTLVSSCDALTRLFKDEKSMDHYVKDGVIESLAAVVVNAGDNTELITSVSATLSRLSTNPAYAAMIMESGCMEDILRMLKEHPQNAKLVENIITLITRLGAASPALLAQLKAMGAVDLVVDALEYYSDSKVMLGLGAQALAVLADKQDVTNTLAKIQTGNTSTSAEIAGAMSKIASLLLVGENIDTMIKSEGIDWLVNALKSYLGSSDEEASKILFNGCQALLRCASDENRIYQIMQKGGVKLLCGIIMAHAKDEKVACSALAALSRMLTRPENATYLIQCGAIQAALALLAANPGSLKTAKSVLEFFQRLAVFEGSVPHMISQGVVEAVVNIMASFPDAPEIQMAAINALGRMAISGENMMKIAAAGGLEKLLKVLEGFKDNAELCKQALLLLESAAFLPANIDRLRQLNANAAILAVMGCHPDNAEIQALCERLTGKLSGQNQLKESIDNVDMLLRGNTQAAGFLNALAAAASVLCNMALVDANVDPLVRQGAIQSLCAAFDAAARLPPSEMRDHMLAEVVAGLDRLSKHPSAPATLFQLSALRGMLKMALSMPDNEEMAAHVMNMAAMLCGHQAYLSKLVADGTIEDIIALAKAHALNEKILAACVRGLLQMATSPDNINKMVAAGACEVLVESMFANLDNVEALMEALALMQMLSDSEEAVQALVKAGAIDAILDAMRQHPDQGALQTQCMSALCRLLISEEIAQLIGEKDGIPLSIKAIRTHYASEPLCEIAVILLDSLASIAENAKRMLVPELATIDLIKYVAATYANNQAILESVSKLLTVLAPPKSESKEMSLSNQAMILDAAKCDVLISNLRGGKAKGSELKSMLANLAQSLSDPNNAKLLVDRGGLQALAQVMKNAHDDEEVFYAAASAFLMLAQSGLDGVNAKLDDPDSIEALCDMMNAHEIFANPMDLSDLTTAVSCVARMKLTPVHIKELLKGKTLNSLLQIFSASDDPALLAQAARLLGKLSNNEDALEALLKLANIRELILAMRRNIENEEFLRYAVFLLGNLAQNPVVMDTIGIEGGIQLILQIMELYPLNQPLIENCVFALANLTFDHDINISFVVACKGIQIIIAVLSQHSKAEELLESAVCVLCNTCANSDTNKELIAKNGGAQAIVDTILNNFNAMDLLLTCFRTLGNLACSRYNIGAIIKAGGVQGIVAGMTVHGDNRDLIDVAIRVLTNLSADLDEENMSILAQEGAVQAIVEVAASFTDDLEIEVATLACLCNLGRFPDNAKTMIYQGAAKATIKMLKKQNYELALTDGAVRLLSILSFCQAEIDRLVGAKATTSVINAFKTHPREKRILISGMSAIANMSYSSDAAAKLNGEGAVDAIIAVLLANNNDPDVLGESYQALSALCRNEKNAESMAERTMATIVSNLPMHSANTRFCNLALAFLGNLCVYPEPAENVIAAGIIASCLALFRKHVNDPVLLVRGLRALENIAYGSARVKQHMKDEGTEAAVQAIADANASRDDVKRAVKGVLDALNRTRTDLSSVPLAAIKLREIEKKSAKSLFSDENENKCTELPQDVKNFLLAGQLIIKHSNTAQPRPRHVYVTPDLKHLVWKDPKKPLDAKHKMKLFKVRSIERGRCTPQLQRKTMFGKFVAKEDCSFAVLGRERSVDLEAKTEAEREKWITSLLMLVDFLKNQKVLNTKFDAR